jgi:hypothetical protein|tara:strand:- start:268 stop:582 length:315 start_codon:yes stop_codon:yes gene_type:complete
MLTTNYIFCYVQSVTETPRSINSQGPFSAFIDVTGQKATSSTRPRYCSVSTEAMASVAFNMSARAAVGGAQLKLSAQRKRGAYPRIVPRGPVSGAPSAGISPRV